MKNRNIGIVVTAAVTVLTTATLLESYQSRYSAATIPTHTKIAQVQPTAPTSNNDLLTITQFVFSTGFLGLLAFTINKFNEAQQQRQDIKDEHNKFLQEQVKAVNDMKNLQQNNFELQQTFLREQINALKESQHQENEILKQHIINNRETINSLNEQLNHYLDMIQKYSQITRQAETDRQQLQQQLFDAKQALEELGKLNHLPSSTSPAYQAKQESIERALSKAITTASGISQTVTSVLGSLNSIAKYKDSHQDSDGKPLHLQPAPRSNLSK